MANYRQIRPSWISTPSTFREETSIQTTPAASTVTVPSETNNTALTGTAAIYQQVITSLQNQVTSLQSVLAMSATSLVVPVMNIEENYPAFTSYYEEPEPPCLPPVEYIPLPGPPGLPGPRGH
jgi:hypothetical protein